MLQRELKISINRDGFNYYRFVSHLHYLMERTQKDALIATQNSDLFESFRDQFPDIYYCAAKIAVLLHRKTGKNLNDEEILYLMLHINRLYAREDCEQPIPVTRPMVTPDKTTSSKQAPFTVCG